MLRGMLARMPASLAGAVLFTLLLASVSDSRATDPPRISSVEGLWTTPGGQLRLTREGERVVGLLEAPARGVALPPGAQVLEGTFFEDNLTADVRLPLLAPACGPTEEKAFVVLLLLTRSGRLTGGVAAQNRCAAGVSSVEWRRAGGPAAPLPTGQGVAWESVKNGPMRQGAALMAEGRFEAARKLFQQAAELSPSRGEPFNGVGVTYAMRNELDEAIAWYKRGLEASPGFGDLYYNLACAYALAGKTDMALRYLRLAATKGYTAPDALDSDPDLAGLRDEPAFAAIRALMTQKDGVAP